MSPILFIFTFIVRLLCNEKGKRSDGKRVSEGLQLHYGDLTQGTGHHTCAILKKMADISLIVISIRDLFFWRLVKDVTRASFSVIWIFWWCICAQRICRTSGVCSRLNVSLQPFGANLTVALKYLRTVPTKYKGFCARLGPCVKSRSL